MGRGRGIHLLSPKRSLAAVQRDTARNRFESFGMFCSLAELRCRIAWPVLDPFLQFYNFQLRRQFIHFAKQNVINLRTCSTEVCPGPWSWYVVLAVACQETQGSAFSSAPAQLPISTNHVHRYFSQSDAGWKDWKGRRLEIREATTKSCLAKDEPQ